VSKCSAKFKLDTSQKEARNEIEILHDLAEYHELEELQETTKNILEAFK
jgi:hypothetical protein